MKFDYLTRLAPWLVALTLNCAQVSAAEPEKSEAFVNNLKAVSGRYSAVDLEWSEILYSNADILVDPDSAPKGARPTDTDRHIKETVHKRATFLGDLFRYRVSYDPSQVKRVPIDFAIGEIRNVLFFSHGTKMAHASATIAPKNDVISENMNWGPCIVFFRPTDARFGGIDIPNATTSSDDRTNKWIVRCKDKTNSKIERTFVFNMRIQIERIEARYNTVLVQICEINYPSGSLDRLPPTGWKFTTLEGGEITETLVATVEKCNLEAGLKPSDFEIELPIGCTVFDKGEGKRYVVQADMKQREVLRSEQTLPHAVLMTTDTGNTSPSRWPRILGITSVVTILALFVVIVWRYRYAR